MPTMVTLYTMPNGSSSPGLPTVCTRLCLVPHPPPKRTGGNAAVHDADVTLQTSVSLANALIVIRRDNCPGETGIEAHRIG
jgi:hypothetical protein